MKMVVARSRIMFDVSKPSYLVLIVPYCIPYCCSAYLASARRQALPSILVSVVVASEILHPFFMYSMVSGEENFSKFELRNSCCRSRSSDKNMTGNSTPR